MTPKPLTKDELLRIERAFSGRPDSQDPRLNYAVETIQELLAAEAFWREAVKNRPEYVDEWDGVHDPACLFCSSDWNRTEWKPKHKPDCPWLLAQEGE